MSNVRSALAARCAAICTAPPAIPEEGTVEERTKAMRAAALAQLRAVGPDLLSALREAGLDPAAPPTADAVETLLMDDPLWCPACGPAAEHQRRCPSTGRPHRRYLVLLAEAFLKIVGDARATVAAADPTTPLRRTAQASFESPPESPDAAPVRTARPRVRRGLALQPHLLLLAFHTAARSDADVDPRQRTIAAQLVEAVALVQQALDAPEPAARSGATPLARLVFSFARTWREYLRSAEELTRAASSPTSPAGNRSFTQREGRSQAAGRELAAASIEAAVALAQMVAAVRAKAGDTAEAEAAVGPLQEQADRMARRVETVGGQDGVRALQAALARLQQTPAIDLTPATSPEPTSRAPFRPTAQAVPDSDSDNDDAPGTPASEAPPAPATEEPGTAPQPTPQAALKPAPQPAPKSPMGPPLPPEWTVGPDGVSQPPRRATVAELAEEKRRALEFKVRSAVKARLPIRCTPAAAAEDDEAAWAPVWEQLAAELGAAPPVVARVPALLSVVADHLVEALPRRLRDRVAMEARDAMDWAAISRGTGLGAEATRRAVQDVVRYVLNTVAAYTSPAHADDVAAEREALLRRLPEDPIALVVVDALKVMMAAVRRLRRDVAEYSLRLVSPELAQRAAEYHREFLADWLPWPRQWPEHNVAWLRAAAQADPAVAPLFAPGGAPSDCTPTALRRVVARGVVSLVASAGKATEQRWAGYPSELLMFERPCVFAAANAVQTLTLRTSVVGAVSMVVGRRLPPPAMHRLGAALDAKLCGWLGAATATPPPSLPATGRRVQVQAPFAPEAENRVLTLPELKQAVLDEANDALIAHQEAVTGGARPAPGELLCLSATEEATIGGVMEKLASPATPEYAAFEARVTGPLLQFLLAAFAGDAPAGDAAATPEEHLGRLVVGKDFAAALCLDLRDMVAYHMGVYAPTYMALLGAV